jgi:hypothetical protein
MTGSIMTRVRNLLYRGFVEFERHFKILFFGCSMCGQCVLSYTGFICPMRCAKQLRNGPCGGTTGDRCEVGDGSPCIWLKIYKRNRALNRLPLMNLVQPPVDWSLWQTSAWINLVTGKIKGPQLSVDAAVEREGGERT